MEKHEILKQLEQLIAEQYQSRAGALTPLQLEAVEWCANQLRAQLEAEAYE